MYSLNCLESIKFKGNLKKVIRILILDSSSIV
jgi:hypothetical protein